MVYISSSLNGTSEVDKLVLQNVRDQLQKSKRWATDDDIKQALRLNSDSETSAEWLISIGSTRMLPGLFFLFYFF